MKLFKDVVRAVGGSVLALGVLSSGAHAAGDDMAGLTPEAAWALSNAEDAVALAKKNGVLWTTAAAALEQAREAAKKRDSAAVSTYAATASEHAALGMGQLAYPQVGKY